MMLTVARMILQILELHKLVLSIPAASNSLRIAYALQLSNLLPDGLRSYPLPDPLDVIWSTFDAFDRGWTTIAGTNEASPEEDEESMGSRTASGERIRMTDRVRLRSIVEECTNALKESIGGPAFVKMRVDPFQEVVVPRFVASAVDLARDESVHEVTPSLTSDDGEVDDYEDRSAQEVDEDEEDEEEEDEMDEVDIDLGIISRATIHNSDLLSQLEFDITLPAATVALSIPVQAMEVDLPIREAEWNDRSLVTSGESDNRVDSDNDDDSDGDQMISTSKETTREIEMVFSRTRKLLLFD